MAGSTSRRLVLLRHAKSDWPDVVDHERPLARRGRRDAPDAGRWLRREGYVPDRVLCSTARRASETWELAGAELGAHPPVTMEDGVYGASPADLLDLAHQTPADVVTLMIVGHEPTMRALTLELAGPPVAGAETAALQRVREKFPTAAIAVLTFDGEWADLGPGHANLTAFAVPADFPSDRRSR
jgi:phosphohistidine phosphatase